MKIALFSDVHGHLRILLHIIRNWQIAHAEYLDAVLVAGDLGCYPDPADFDKATRRWIERDPEEAGFSAYFTKPVAIVELLFAGDDREFSAIRCPILSTAGNHESYPYLAKAGAQKTAENAPPNTFPVDCYQRIHFIRDGQIATLIGPEKESIRVAAVWGIENTRPNAPYRIKPESIDRLTSTTFDLLLTHDAPAEAYPLGGSKLIQHLIQSTQPPFHVFGHVHPIQGRHAFSVSGASTQSYIFEDVSFGRDGRKSLVGSMGLLEWTGSDPKIGVLQEAWLDQMRSYNWSEYCPGPRQD